MHSYENKILQYSIVKRSIFNFLCLEKDRSTVCLVLTCELQKLQFCTKNCTIFNFLCLEKDRPTVYLMLSFEL